MVLAVEQLQILYGVLDVDDSACAVFHVDLTRLYQFPHLASSQMQRVLPIPWSVAIGKTVAMRFHAPTQSLISSHPPQFDERLSFKRLRLPFVL